MSENLWKFYFENDLESFQHLLANATFTASGSTKSPHGGRGVNVGSVGSAGAVVGTSPILTGKNRKSLGRKISGLSSSLTSPKLVLGANLTRTELNRKDTNGVSLLQHISSSLDECAPKYALTLFRAPVLDLYVQDAENGWTALHRALYFGNITIARALMNRDLHDVILQNRNNSAHEITGLIKVKDHEGNSPFDVYNASISSRDIRRLSTIPLLSGSSDDEENEIEHGLVGDEGSDDADTHDLLPNISINGDEVFAFGSNKNFNLGFGDEDDRQHPERISLTRPDHLLQRLHIDHQSRKSSKRASEPTKSSRSFERNALPALVRFCPMIIQDVQLSKLHSAILTTDPESNLYMCGFGPRGRLGTGDETTRFHFVNVAGGGLVSKRVIHVALGQDHTLAVSSNGEVFSWGSNSFGQLGYSLPTSKLQDDDPVQLVPRQIFGPVKREAIIGAAASRTHSVLHTVNSMYTFGKNDGQLGLVDSDARSLEIQNTPRKVAASLFSSPIASVSALDRASICLLESHDVWVFANYGYTKLVFPLETLSDPFLQSNRSATRYNGVENHIIKIASGGETICALTSMGDVFTLRINVKVQSDAVTTSSTTNPSKIRGALSSPQRVWSTQKAHMAVKDVAVCQDSSIIICTASGSVWRRIKRTKIKYVNAPGVAEPKSKDYKFSRVGGLTKVTAVRSSTFGAYAAIRVDVDVLKTQVEADVKHLWTDLYPLLPFLALGTEEEDSNTETPVLRFWGSSLSTGNTAILRNVVLTCQDLEERLTTVLKDHKGLTNYSYDLKIQTTSSDVMIPVHEFIVSARSVVMRQALRMFRQNYFFSIPEVMTIEYGNDGKTLITFLGADIITVLNLVLYMYTDTVVDVWRQTRHAPQLAFRYRQIRVELMKIANQLGMRILEQAVRNMVEPTRSLHHDMTCSICDPSFLQTGDIEIEIDGANVRVHSALMRQRCPFFEGLLNGRAAGSWLSSRRQIAQDSQEVIKVDLKHVDSEVFRYVLQYLYADVDDELFDDTVTPDLDTFLDLIMDVMDVANELMLERLQQICQKFLGRFGQSLIYGREKSADEG